MSLATIIAGPRDLSEIESQRGPIEDQTLAELTATLSSLTDELKARKDEAPMGVSKDGVQYVLADDAVLYTDFGQAIDVYDEIRQRLDIPSDSEKAAALEEVSNPSLDVALIQLATRLRTTAGIPAHVTQGPSEFVIVMPDSITIGEDAARISKSVEVRNYAVHISRLQYGAIRPLVAAAAQTELLNGNIPIKYFDMASNSVCCKYE